MTNERPPYSDGVDDVDWWASRLVDHEIDFADVPADLRSAVQDRARRFLEIRNRLLRSVASERVEDSVVERAVQSAVRPTTSGGRARSFFVPLSAAAAVVAVIAIGLTLVDGGDSDSIVTSSADANSRVETSVVASADQAMAATEMAPAAAGAKIESVAITIDTAEQLVAFAREWVTSTPAVRAEPICSDVSPALEIEATHVGLVAEVHFDADRGATLVAVDDCRLLLEVSVDEISR